MRERAGAGSGPLLAAFVEALERLQREEKRFLKALPATQQREEQAAPECCSQTAPAPAASASFGSAAAAAGATPVAAAVPTLLRQFVWRRQTEVEEAQQRLAELLRVSRRKKLLHASINNSSIRAAEFFAKSSLQTSEEVAPQLQKQRSLQRQTLSFPQAFPPPPPPTDAETEGKPGVVAERRKLLEGLVASEAGSLAIPAQVEAAEGVADEVQTLAAAVQLLLGSQVAAVTDLESHAASLRRQLQEAREELDEAAKQQLMGQCTEALTVQAAAPSQAFVVSASASPEGRSQLVEALRLTKCACSNCRGVWNTSGDPYARKYPTDSRRPVKNARRRLLPFTPSEATSSEPLEPQGQQQKLGQGKGPQQQRSRKQSRKHPKSAGEQAAAVEATIQLLGTQRVAEEELQIFQHVAGSPQSLLAALMKRLEQLEAKAQHKIAGLNKSLMRIEFEIEPEVQYGLSLLEKMQLEDKIKLLLRSAEALLTDLRTAKASAGSLQQLSSVVKNAQDFGWSQP
ncbi:hypothetical protein Esti_004502 [Eimeria stiedai]